MASFTDRKKRKWIVSVSIPLARKVKQALDVDILNVQTGLPALSADPLLLCDVLYVLCREQADRLKVTDEEFGECLAGDVLEQACDAYVEALISFSPPRRGRILSSMQTTAVELETTLAGLAEKKIPEAVKRLREAVSGS